MCTKDYNAEEKNSGNTATHIATDEPIQKKYGNMQLAYEEGFASASGVRPATAETGGRVKHPETLDESVPDRVPDSIEAENAGLADS